MTDKVFIKRTETIANIKYIDYVKKFISCVDKDDEYILSFDEAEILKKTGKKDINGIDIYSRSLVKAKRNNNEFVFEIKYSEDAAAFMAYGGYDYEYYLDELQDIEVINS